MRAPGLGSDDHWYEETLYRTKKGAWFLAGSGGPSTKYAERVGPNGGWIEGSGLFVLSRERALHWLEEHQETEAIERYFAGQIEEA
jgi:hypothetical protein